MSARTRVEKPVAKPNPWGGLDTLLGAGLIGLAVVIAYGRTFSVPFVLDDQPSIVDNASLRHWASALTPPATSSTFGRPIMNLSFALNYALSGTSVGSYHLLNLLIHLSCAWLLFGVVRRSLAASWGQQATMVATAAALLWAVHPLDTEAVTYLTQRGESLMGLFYLLSLYCFIRAYEPGAKRTRLFAGLSVGSCLLGMMTKEVMVSLPLCVLLYDRAFIAGSFRSALRTRAAYYLGVASTWIVLAALVLSTHGRAGTAGFEAGISVWYYALTQAYGIGHYLLQTLVPSHLVFFYGAEVHIAPMDVAPGAIVVLALLAATIWALVRRPKLGFLGACFFLILAPSSSVVPIATETIAEHRMYLALVPIIVVIALALFRWGGRAAPWVAGIAGLALTAATYARNQVYQTHLALWADTVAHDPTNPWGLTNLGAAFDEVPGHTPEAIAEFKEAIRVQPRHAEAHYDLGVDLSNLGEKGRAIAEYEEAVRDKPTFAKARNNLGVEIVKVPGRFSEAVDELKEAIRLDPGYGEAHSNLGFALSLMPGRQAEAREEFETAITLAPTFAPAHSLLGKLLASDPASQDRAAQELEEAARLTPDSAESAFDAGTMLSRNPGRKEDAVRYFQRAIELRPEYAEARNNLARLWADDPNRWSDVVTQLRLALKSRPDFSEGKFNLAMILMNRPGNEAEAKGWLRSYLRANPGNAQAQQALDWLNSH